MLILTILAAVSLQPKPPPARVPAVASLAQVAPRRQITGFRSARFRTSAREVRTAIARDFPGILVIERFQPGEGTRVLQLTAPTLEPGPGPAVISYVFGATSRTLALVTVSWATKAAAKPADRQAIAAAALRLLDVLRAAPQPRRVIAPRVVCPGVVTLYGGLDDSGAAVELTASGIEYAAEGTAPSAAIGPAALRLSYAVNPANPDVLGVKK